MAITKPRKPAVTGKPKPEAAAAPVVRTEVTLPETVPVAPPVAEPVPVVGENKPAEAPAKAPKVKKPKLVRDSFTFPETDYALIARLKQRALTAGCEIKKSEILRAGLTVLEALPDAELVKVLGAVERIKTGRPAKK